MSIPLRIFNKILGDFEIQDTILKPTYIFMT